MPKSNLTPSQERDMAIFSDNLKDLMKRKKVTQVELSQATGIARTTISSYARRSAMPSSKNVQLIADYFNVDKEDLDPRFTHGDKVDSGYIYFAENDPIELDKLIEKAVPMSFQGKPINPDYLNMIKKLLKED